MDLNTEPTVFRPQERLLKRSSYGPPAQCAWVYTTRRYFHQRYFPHQHLLLPAPVDWNRIFGTHIEKSWWRDLESGSWRLEASIAAFQEALSRAPHNVPSPALAELYEAKVEEARRAVKVEVSEKILTQAWMNRKLMECLMDEEWLGLHVLAQLRNSIGMSATDLASKTGASVDSIASVLAQLVRYEAVDVQHRTFICSEGGGRILQRLEKETGVRLEL